MSSQCDTGPLKYGLGTPDDWIERRLYAEHDRIGMGSLLVLH